MICSDWIQNMRTGQTRESMGVKITLKKISYRGDYADRFTILDLDVRGKIYLNQQLWLRGDRKWKGSGGDGSYVEIEMGTISARRLPDFHVCADKSFIEPTLTIDNVFVELSPAGDVPKYNRSGVYLEVHLSGAGTGILKLSWGTDHSETKTGIVAGNYAYVYNLPPGTHNVCAELFSVE